MTDGPRSGEQRAPIKDIALARRGVTLHPLVTKSRGDPGGPYEKEGQSLDPGFLAKASELADRTIQSAAAADPCPRRAAVTDRQAAFDVVEVGSPRLIVRPHISAIQNVTSKVPAVT